VRSSAGALFRLAVTRAGSVDDVLGALRSAGLPTVATVAHGAAPAYDEVDLTRPLALILGSEPHGLDEPVLAAVDQSVTIPMAGRTESLNVAMAGTIVCFEALRQRRHAAPARPANPLDARPAPAAG
jgi:TrmH family RNA methyltransferase